MLSVVIKCAADIRRVNVDRMIEDGAGDLGFVRRLQLSRTR